jgi:hypothetical protein
MRPNVEHQEDPTPDQTGEQTSPQHTNDQTGEMTTEPPTQRVTVAEAARLLGTSAEAVRMRVKRGSLRSTKIKNTVYVLLSPEQTRPNQDQTSGSIGSAANQTSDQTTNETDDRTLLLDSLRSQVEFLQEELKRREEVHVEENRRKDTIIAQLTQRIPELEPPKEATQEPRESRETPSESPTTSREWPLGHEGETYGTSAQEAEDSLQGRPSWWRRFFGLE